MQEVAFSERPAALAALARDLLGREIGERLPTVGQYQERLAVGSGTVQARLQILAELGAIRLQPRGQRGTFLLDADRSKLWAAAGFGAVRGVLPLPEAAEPLSLAVLLRRGFEERTIPLELLYLHGSARRIELVRDGMAHFAIASKPAAEEAIRAHPGLWHTVELGAESYHREDSNVVLLRAQLGSDDRIAKIGMDTGCHDHVALTRAEFPEDEGYVYSPYSHSRLPVALAEGLIDAAIWLRTSPVIPLSAVGIATRPLHRAAAIEINRALGCAVLVIDSRHPEVAAVLPPVEPASVRRIQDEILRSDELPLY